MLKYLSELLVFVAFANLPFYFNKWFLCFPVRSGKTLALRVVELLVCYLVVGVVCGAAEISENGSRYSQDWQFFAITLCLCTVFAYPGFVFRYLWPRDLKS